MAEYPEELKSPGYELFLSSLGLLAVVNVLIYYLSIEESTKDVMQFMNGFFSLVFMGDLFYRLLSARSKMKYMFQQYGWADLLSCIPSIPFKLFRLVRLYRTRQMAEKMGMKKFVRQSISSRSQNTVYSLLILIFLFLEFGAMIILFVEIDAPNSNIKSASDAIWYTFVTIATVGYGDRYPVSLGGRIVGMFIMLAGVSLFSAFAGYLANFFMRPERKTNLNPTENEDKVTLQSQLNELKELIEKQKQSQDDLDKKIKQLDEILDTHPQSKHDDSLFTQ